MATDRAGRGQGRGATRGTFPKYYTPEEFVVPRCVFVVDVGACRPAGVGASRTALYVGRAGKSGRGMPEQDYVNEANCLGLREARYEHDCRGNEILHENADVSNRPNTVRAGGQGHVEVSMGASADSRDAPAGSSVVRRP